MKIDLIKCGEALYGPRFQSELARDLGVADRTMRRWIAGDTAIPDGVADDLLRLMKERRAILSQIIRENRKRHPSGAGR